MAGVARVVERQRRRRHVIRAAPDLHLPLAVLLGGLRLVQALQRAVVALVEPPGVDDRDPHLVELIQRDPERADGAFEDGCVGHVENVAALTQQLAALVRLDHALLREIDIGPAGIQVLFVPDALAVAEQNYLMHSSSIWDAEVQNSECRTRNPDRINANHSAFCLPPSAFPRVPPTGLEPVA